jgi:large subunit ribosomal protein L24e
VPCGESEALDMKCSFCDGTIPTGKGKMLVKNDGRVFHYCSSKCQKNSRLKRDGKKLKWTKMYAKQKK